MVKTDIHFDPENELLCIRSVDETGAVIADLPQVRIALADLQYADQVGGAPVQMVCRRVHYVDGVSGAKKRIYLLATIAADDATDDGHSVSAADSGDAVQDLYLGGGVVMMAMVSYHQSAANGDYLVCRPPGGDSGGADDVKVAVEPHLQSGIATQTMPNGDAWGFTSYTEATQQRTSTKGTTVLTEYISPPFLTTDMIPVEPCANTGVTVSGTVLTLVARTGRQWASV
jgi:hypothetical protein